MKLNLSFKEEDFFTLSTVEDAIRKQLGNNVYVGSQSLCVYLYFPANFADVFHSAPETYECELKSSLSQGNVKLSFTKKDFKSRRDFDNAVARQLNNTANVLSDVNGWSVAYYFEYPKKLVAMIHPFPEEKKFDFELESSSIIRTEKGST